MKSVLRGILMGLLRLSRISLSRISPNLPESPVPNLPWISLAKCVT
jgi:hypothetical protein